MAYKEKGRGGCRSEDHALSIGNLQMMTSAKQARVRLPRPRKLGGDWISL